MARLPELYVTSLPSASPQPYELGALLVSPVLPVRKLRPREVKHLAQIALLVSGIWAEAANSRAGSGPRSPWRPVDADDIAALRGRCLTV